MIYFIHNPALGAIKIGYSADPRSRFKQLQTASPYRLVLVATIPGDLTTEAELHRRFADRRMVGEWFWFEDPGEMLYMLNFGIEPGDCLGPVLSEEELSCLARMSI